VFNFWDVPKTVPFLSSLSFPLNVLQNFHVSKIKQTEKKRKNKTKRRAKEIK
jgi:hypothetical protein